VVFDDQQRLGAGPLKWMSREALALAPRSCQACLVIDDFAKGYLLDDLRWVRKSVVETLDGLTEYEIRRPMTASGTNLLGLIKHLALSEAVYLGDVLGRPFPEPHRRFDDPGFANRDSLWVGESEPRAEVIRGYERACRHADTTVEELPITAKARVPWWPQPDAQMFNVLVHVLTETNRHAGHADILREGLRNTSGDDVGDWAAHFAEIERAARHHR
jgi:hypothetical protein